MRDWRKKILIISLFLTLFLPVFVLAAASSDLSQYKPQLSVQIGENTIDFDAVSCAPGEECEIGWISQYVVAVYRYGVGLAAILAAIMIMVGGFLWLTSGGSPDRVGKAKEFITGSLTGLLLALFSYLILYTINPRLVALEPISITRPQEIVLQSYSDGRRDSGGRLIADPSAYYVPPGEFDARTAQYIRNNEGLRLDPYRDLVATDRWVVGYGHLVTGQENLNPPLVDANGNVRSITQAEAEQLLSQDLSSHEAVARRWIGEDAWETLSEDRRLALTDMAYQMGGVTLGEFTGTRTAIREALGVQSCGGSCDTWQDVYDHMMDSAWADQTPNRAGHNAVIMLYGSMESLLSRR